MSKFQTTEAYLSGGICGPVWWPAGAMCGTPLRVDLRCEFSRFSAPATWRDVLDHILTEHGGDFQNAKFTADTRLVVVRKANDGAGKYCLHVWERELAVLTAAADLVEQECYTGDFMGDCE